MKELNRLSEKLGFDEDDVLMLLELFLESSQVSLAQIEDAIEQNDFQKVYTESHSIKGSAANLMLADIVEISKELEVASKKEQKMKILSFYKKLEDAIENIARLEYANV